MPAYQFYRLSPDGDEAAPIQMRLYSDEAAMRRALSAQFPTGCDVWQDGRFVGQFHPPAKPPSKG
jgi:hypothetical protein